MIHDLHDLHNVQDLVADANVTGTIPPAPIDRPGRLTISAQRRSRGGAQVQATLIDPDGVARVTAATLTASDGNSRDVLFTTRQDANTIASENMVLQNNRWRDASLSVTYLETGGAQRTLTESYSV